MIEQRPHELIGNLASWRQAVPEPRRRSYHRGLTGGQRRLRGLCLTSALLAGLLGGCGVIGTGLSAYPSAADPTSALPGPMPSSTISVASPSGPRAASADTDEPAPDLSGPSYGVDRRRWPTTLNGARKVLQAMPTSLDGRKRDYYYTSGAGEDPPSRDAGVVYDTMGSVSVYEEYRSNDTADGSVEIESANNQLSAVFGLMFGCKKGSYRGNAPRPAYPGGGPGVTTKPLTTDIWFSCTIDGAEGDDDFTGEAVGWTSGKTAWLVLADSRTSARTLVTALVRAQP